MAIRRPGSRQRRSLKKRWRRGNRVTVTTWTTDASGERREVVLDGRRKKCQEAYRSRTPGNPWALRHAIGEASVAMKAGSQTPVGPDSGQAV